MDTGLVAGEGVSTPLSEMQFANQETAGRMQAQWRRMLPIFAAISYGFAALAFCIVYFWSGLPPSTEITEAAVFVAGGVAGILSLALYSVASKKAVSTIAIDDTGLTLGTIVGHRQVLRWDDPRFRLVLWNRGPAFGSFSSTDDAGVLNAPRGFVGWPTRMARASLLRVAREHGVQAWTWNPWVAFPPFPSRTLLARQLSFTDRFGGLRIARPDS